MYCYPYEIQQEDINYGGHVGNERALLFFQRARMALFESLGFSELDIGNGIGVIQNISHVEYKKELYLGDRIVVTIDRFQGERASFTLNYTITMGVDIAMIGYTKLVAFDYAIKKIRRIPADFQEKLKERFSNPTPKK
jgi:acyl-CoA thioester hydrolase